MLFPRLLFLVLGAATSLTKQFTLPFARRDIPVCVQELATLRYSPNSLACFFQSFTKSGLIPYSDAICA